MSALVPYRLAAAALRSPGARLYRTAMVKKAGSARRYIKYGTRIARFVVNRYRKRKFPFTQTNARLIKRLRGNPSTRNTSQKVANDPRNANLTYPMSTINTRRFVWPPYDNGTISGDNLISRTRNHIFLKGIKICWLWTHINNPVNEVYMGPVKVRWYLIQSKDNLAATTPNLNTRFFRTNNGGISRNQDFNPATGNVNDSWDLAKLCAPVNPDETFRILTKREFILNGQTNDGSYRGLPKNQYMLQKYFKINKRLNFDATTSDFPDGEIFCIWWYHPVSPDRWIPLSGNLSVMNLATHDQVYFSDKTS